MNKEFAPEYSSTIRLHGRWLHSARIAWLVVTALVIIASAHSIDISIRSASIATAIGVNPVGDVGQRLVYQSGGLCLSGCIPLSVVHATLLRLGLWCVYFVVAAILFWRRSDELTALVAAIGLVTFGATDGTFVSHIDTAPWTAALDVPPIWFLLTVVVELVGLASLIIFCYTFPNGRFVPKWTIWVIMPIAAYMVVILFLNALNFPHLPSITEPTFVSDDIATIPGLPLAGDGHVPYTLGAALAQSVNLLVFFVPLAQGYRFLRVSTPIQRQQTKWVVFGLVVAIIGACLMWTGYYVAVGPDWFPYGLTAQCFELLVPLAILIAIMHYRLWDIDLIINRTLVYSLLTLGVVALYVAAVSSLGLVVQGQAHLASSLLATGVVAMVFQPLRQRLQWGVNRLLYGERDEPYAVLSRLGQRLEGTLAPEALLSTIVQTIAYSLKLPYAALALPQGEHLALAVSVGSPPPLPLTIPLVHQGEPVGQLLLAPRPGEHAFSQADRRLLDDLARQAGIALHAVQLAVDLQHSRERLVTLREEERRRLRRDLHDGMGPALASILMNLSAIRHHVAPESPAYALLVQTRSELQTVIGDIRRLVYDLRPPALDELGLVGAIRQSAAAYEQQSLSISVQAPEPLPPLPAAVEVASYRIAQEALTNVVRHAQAHTCTIQICLTSGLDLVITDDGAGVPAERHMGVGLSSMKERAAELGGSCVIEPGPGGGTRVLAHLPLPEG